jgi:hypothetical protein
MKPQLIISTSSNRKRKETSQAWKINIDRKPISFSDKSKSKKKSSESKVKFTKDRPVSSKKRYVRQERTPHSQENK